MKKVLIGLLAGVAIGILIAPDKGSATWKKIVDGLDDLKDKASNELNTVVEKGKDWISKGKETVSKATN